MTTTSPTILYLDSHEHATCDEKFAGARRFANAVGWNIVRRKTTASPKRLLALLARVRPAGCIVNANRFLDALPPAAFDGRSAPSARDRPAPVRKPVPVVYLDTDARLFDKSACVVAHDSVATGRLAADELLKLNFASYFFLPYRRPAFWSDLRERGFRARLAEAGADARVLTVAEARRTDFRNAGVFAANDEMALHLVARLKAHGLRIPEDVAVISADDTEEAASAGVTSIRIDFEQGGYLAARCLAEKLARRHPAADVRFGDICVRPRQSTRHFACHLPKIPAAVALIRERAAAGLTAREVVAFLGCSRRKAETAFRRATGRSILEEIQNTRLEFACDRLSRSAIAIQSLTDFCGYRTPQALRKAFKRRTGMSMADWRRRQTPISPHG
jgi:AraC-like DNA-binding protein